MTDTHDAIYWAISWNEDELPRVRVFRTLESLRAAKRELSNCGIPYQTHAIPLED